MEKLNLKPTHKAVRSYYEALNQFKIIGVSHEGAVRSAFQTLLEVCGRQFNWKLVPEWPIKQNRAHALRVDGALVDEFRLTHGFWEAKDSHDDLGKEVKKKLTAGYPQSGITNDPNRADDPQYIVRLIGQVITVSLETVRKTISLSHLSLYGLA